MIKINDYIIKPLEFDYRVSETRAVKKKEKAKGDETTALIGFFPTVPSALKRIRKLEMDKKLSEVDYDLDEAINVIEKFSKEFENVVKNMEFIVDK